MTRPDPVALTEQLVGYDTVSRNPNAALASQLAEIAEGLGGRPRLLPKAGDAGQVNLLARFGPDGPGGLALCGHSDTVPWSEGARATTRAERDGRRLYGRGTCDMKGGIAAMLDAVARTDRAGLRKPLWLAFTYQEETGCHGAKALLASDPLQVEHCIIGEPTGLRPVLVHKGYAIAEILLHGRPCHSSDPEQGASALHAAARALDAVLGLGERWKREATAEPAAGPALSPPWPTVNVGLLQGGSARNVVPERASLTVELRPLPGQSPAALLSEVEGVARDAVASVPGTVTMEFRRLEADEPLQTPSESGLVRWLVARTGQSPGSVPFYTEGAIFNRMGARTCVCGPGGIAQAHRADEWVEMDALLAASDLYADAIREFCT